MALQSLLLPQASHTESKTGTAVGVAASICSTGNRNCSALQAAESHFRFQPRCDPPA